MSDLNFILQSNQSGSNSSIKQFYH